MKTEATCPYCGQKVTVEHRPAKWQGGKARVIIKHKKWQKG